MDVRRRPGGGGGGSGRGLLEGDEGKSRLARFDLFPKVEAQVEMQTQSGGMVTMICLGLMVTLLWSELLVFLVSGRDFKDKIAVDHQLRDRVQINLDITFHALSCSQVELVTMDATGEFQMHADAQFEKVPIMQQHLAGDCLSCYGAGDAGRCCNSCAELVEAYREMGWNPMDAISMAQQCSDARERKIPLEQLARESDQVKVIHGCRLRGNVQVNKVAGNVHVALGHGRSVNGRLIHQFSPDQMLFFNTSHTIHHFWFGTQPLPGTEGSKNALDGRVQIIDPHRSKTGAFQYYLEIVPTEYRNRRYYQYTKTEQYSPIGEGDHGDAPEPHKGHGHAQPAVISTLPGVFFVYDLSPFVVLRTDLSLSFSQFLTNLFAIVGGTFALSKFVDRFFHSLFGCKL